MSNTRLSFALNPQLDQDLSFFSFFEKSLILNPQNKSRVLSLIDYKSPSYSNLSSLRRKEKRSSASPHSHSPLPSPPTPLPNPQTGASSSIDVFVIGSRLVDIVRLIEEEIGGELFVLVACEICLDYHVAVETEKA